jgi:hypothetical protein
MEAVMEQPSPTLTVVIQWSPMKGQFAVQWPEVDDVIRFGLLQMAASNLSEARIKAGLGATNQLIVPARQMPS